MRTFEMVLFSYRWIIIDISIFRAIDFLDAEKKMKQNKTIVSFVIFIQRCMRHTIAAKWAQNNKIDIDKVEKVFATCGLARQLN